MNMCNLKYTNNKIPNYNGINYLIQCHTTDLKGMNIFEHSNFKECFRSILNKGMYWIFYFIPSF